MFIVTSCWQYPIVGEADDTDTTQPDPDPDPPPPTEPTEIPLGFDYSLTRTTNLMVDVSFTDGTPYAGAVLELFLEDVCTASNKDTKRVMRFRVDQQGRLRSIIDIPVGLDFLYLCPKSSGFPTVIPIEIDKENNEARLVFNQANAPGDASTMHDEYSGDNWRFYNNYYPTRSTWSTLMYEDSWPRFDDYDMNDLVLDYRFEEVTNQDNSVVEINMDFRFRATCAGFNNAFAIELPVAPTKINSVIYDRESIFHGNVNTIGSGLEAGHPEASVVVVTDDITRFIPQFINCQNGGPTLPPGELQIKINFNEPIPKSTLRVAPYKPFLIPIPNGSNYAENRGMEIHLPNRRPTALANLSVLGTNDDDSDPSNGRYYLGIDRRNWGMHIHGGMEVYPTPNSRIDEAFLNFRPWAISGGSEFYDWHKDRNGYRNNELIFLD